MIKILKTKNIHIYIYIVKDDIYTMVDMPRSHYLIV